MKTFSLWFAVLPLACVLSACDNSDRYTAFEKIIEQQNKTILDQQQSLLDQQQKLQGQELQVNVLTAQVAADEEVLKKLQDAESAAPVDATPKKVVATVDTEKMQAVRYITGFNARLSANIGYGAYSDSLGDLNSNLAQSLLLIKDQAFVNAVNQILLLYNYAGDFWGRLANNGVDEIVLSPTDRYKYANVGVNFVDTYHPRESDVKKFWTQASNELTQLVAYNSQDLGLADTSAR